MNVLIKPIVTEKASKMSELMNCYTFEVNTKANKTQIKKAIERKYGVTVTQVRTVNVRPNRTTKYTKTGVQKGKTKAIKKAMIQLSEGDLIDIYDQT